MKNVTIAYADCLAGISGDMFLAALLDAGLPEEVLRADLARLGLTGWQLEVSQRLEGMVQARRVEVRTKTKQPARTWKAVQALLTASNLPPAIRTKALAVFELLAAAEARVHGTSMDAVHFHELGAVDALIDIVGTASGLVYLEIDTLIASPLPMPRGFVNCAHGLLPVPAPAVCEILKDVPVYGVDLDQEMVTPTGAALLKALASGFGSLPAMVIRRVGYGAGSRMLPAGRPNLFRLIIGEAREPEESQEVEVIETNLDDWSPEGYPHLVEQLMGLGALDVSLTPMQMKKGRPGFLLRVIATPVAALQLKQAILTETTAIGLRFRNEKRLTLPRRQGTVATPWGAVQVKEVETPAGPVLTPEYEDCRRVALEQHIPLRAVYAEIGRHGPAAFVPATGEKKE
ncbi:MAG: TIGR00299 family protein [Deltaproteobacteria bacterium RIFOXYD12_FULL_57_12]|nr:MAG: TIGR00299 family protein [Deltaproteobacteria bacterium RIFOXYD12_FULL_57_12]